MCDCGVNAGRKLEQLRQENETLKARLEKLHGLDFSAGIIVGCATAIVLYLAGAWLPF